VCTHCFRKRIIHGGVVADSLINYFDKFGPELLVIQFGFLVITSTLFLWLWFSNRRKYHNLKHAIPANVVKSYLDSIIQNSTALKSSLFRGGGLDLNGVPSVMPVQQLVGGDNIAISGAPSTALMEELNQKKAQIASLEAQLAASKNAQRAVEAELAECQKKLAIAEARIKELEALLAKAKASGGGGDTAIQAELDSVTGERNELKERLKEFEIISDDLADLKRLKQENEQLKRSLAARDGATNDLVLDQPMTRKASAPAADLLDDLGSKENSNQDEMSSFEDFVNSENNSSDEIVNSESEIGEPESLNEEMASSDESPIPADLDPMSGMNSTETNDNLGADEALSASGMSDSSAESVPPVKNDKASEDLLSEFEKMLG
jgi:hypothetical protein